MLFMEKIYAILSRISEKSIPILQKAEEFLSELSKLVKTVSAYIAALKTVKFQK